MNPRKKSSSQGKQNRAKPNETIINPPSLSLVQNDRSTIRQEHWLFTFIFFIFSFIKNIIEKIFLFVPGRATHQVPPALEQKNMGKIPIKSTIHEIHSQLAKLHKQAQYQDFENLYQQVISGELKVIPTISIFHMRLDCLLKQKRYHDFEYLYQNILSNKFKILPNIYILNLRLTYFIKQKQYQDYENLHQQLLSGHFNFSPDSATFSIRLEYLFKQKRYQDFEELYQQILSGDLKLSPDIILYYNRLNYLFKQERDEDFEILYGQIISGELKVTPNLHFFNLRLDYLLKQERYQDFEILYQQIIAGLYKISPNHILYCTRLNYLLKQERYQDFEVLYQQIVSGKLDVLPNEFIYSVRLNYLLKLNQYQDFENLYQQIASGELKILPNLYILTTRLEYLTAQARYQDFESLYDEIISGKLKILPNSFIFNARLDCLFKQKRYQEFEELYQKITSNKSSISPNIYLLNTRLDYLFKQKRYQDFENLYQQIMANQFNFFSDSTTFSIRLRYLLKQNRYQDFESLYGQIMAGKFKIPPHNSILNLGLDYFHKKKQHQNFESLYKQIMAGEFKTPPPIYILNPRLNSLHKQGRHQEFEELYHQIINGELKIPPDIATLNIRLDYLHKQGRHQEFEELYQQIMTGGFNQYNIFPENSTLSIRLHYLHKQERYHDFEILYGQIQSGEFKFPSNTYIFNIRLDYLLKQGRDQEFENLYQQIISGHFKQFNIFPETSTFAVRLKYLLKQKRYQAFENLYQLIVAGRLSTSPDIYIYSIRLSYFLKQKHYQEFDYLYQQIESGKIKNISPNIFIYHIRLIYFFEQDKIEQALDLFNSLPEEIKTIKTYLIILKNSFINSHQITHKNLPEVSGLIKTIYDKLMVATHTHIWKKDSIKFILCLQRVMEEITKNIKSKEKKKLQIKQYREYIVCLLTNVQAFIQKNEIKKITLLEATLLKDYLNYEAKLAHESLTENEANAIQERVYEKLNRPLTAEKMSYCLSVITPYGQKIRELKFNHSIFHLMTNHELGEYIIVEFQHRIKPNKIPIYIEYENTTYQLDVFGGNKLKPNQDNSFAVIGITLRAADFFKMTNWFPSEGSWWYGDRAFRMGHEGIWGKMRIAVVPDQMLFSIDGGSDISQDGCGFLNQDTWEKHIKNTPKTSPPPAKPTYEKATALSDQAIHFYDAAKYRRVVEELFEKKAPAIIALKLEFNQKDFSQYTVEQWVNRFTSAFSNFVPKESYIAVPVSGNQIILSNKNSSQKNISAKVVGRNPYSSQNLQFIPSDNIVYSTVNHYAIQFTLTGLTTEKNHIIGHSAKGLSRVRKFPDALKDVDIVIPAKDFKLCQAWKTEAAKIAAQNPQEIYYYNFYGMLLVIEYFKHLIGLPLNTLEATSGDGDGDPYDVASCDELNEFAKMVAEEAGQQIPNPKQPKGFVQRTQISNRTRLLNLHQPLVETWATINAQFYNLSKKGKRLFSEAMIKNHQLKNFISDKKEQDRLLNSYHKTDSITLTKIEIQLGQKHGEDAPKAEKIDIQPISLQRGREYQSKLSHFNPNGYIPYNKKHIKKTVSSILNRKELTFTEMKASLEQALLADISFSPDALNKADNLPGKLHRAAVRLFLFHEQKSSSKNKKDELFEYISDDDHEYDLR